MPEGDTIFRAAAALRAWLSGRTITAARSTVGRLEIERVVGRVVRRVDTVGKNLLITFDARNDLYDDAHDDAHDDVRDDVRDGDELVLHTHMKMTGSWHLYPVGVRWQKPARQARVVLEASDRIAVCFNAPIVELASPSVTKHRRSLSGLGPDILAEPLDVARVLARACATDASYALGELLLDQRIVCGIGNIYRCEALFLERQHPWTRRSALTDERLGALVVSAARLMRANLGTESARAQMVGRQFGAGGSRTWVYRRTGLGCRVCGSTIVARDQGPMARRAYWCPGCQVDAVT